MKTSTLPIAGKVTIIALIAATAGVIMQIISGAPYPPVPPVFFILLIPAAIIAFGQWRWRWLIAIIAGLFLSLGLFTSGAYRRLFNSNNPGDAIGLWIQALAVGIAVIAAMVAFVHNNKSRSLLEIRPDFKNQGK